MSRSTNQSITNPARFFMEWSSTDKAFRYWKKGEEKGQGENIIVPMPIRFLVLDTLNTIRGYIKSQESSCYANEVRDIKKDEFVVKTKKGVIAKGLYDDIITDGNLTGMKFCKSVYCMMRENDDFFIANFQLTGTALGQWIDFCKTTKILQDAVEIASTEEGKNGAVTYTKPVFTKIPVSKETDEAAKKLDIELQQYLSAYFKARKEIVDDEVVEQKIQEEEKQEVITRSEQPEKFTPNPEEPLPF